VRNAECRLLTARQMTIRDVLKGLSDTLENLLAYSVLSVCWWLAVFLVLPAPGATIALLAATDPRVVNSTGRPDVGEAIELTGHYLWRGWLLVLMTLPLLAILGINLWSYRNAEGLAAALGPLWVALLFAIVMIAMLAISCIALFDDELARGIQRACSILARRPLPALLIAVLLVLFLAGCAVLVVPLVLFYPAMAGAIVNRFVLRTFGAAIPDPLDPTAERRAEEQRERSARRFGP
jgi:hypothetical protein